MANFKDPEDEKNAFLALVDQLPTPSVPRAYTSSTYSGTPANVSTTYASPYGSLAPVVNPTTTNTTNTENPEEDIADLLKRIDDLTKKNGELAREAAHLKNLNSGLVKQHKLDDENINQLNQYADQVETESRELTRTNRELQLELVNIRIAHNKLQADLANTRIERDSALVTNEGHFNIMCLHGELVNTNKEIEEANKRIKNYELWFIGQSHGPTIMGPITPPRRKGDVAFAAPSTPEKSILHLNGSKVRSVEMELKRKVDLYNAEHGTNYQTNKYQQNPAKTAWKDKHGVYHEVMDGLPFAAPEHRAMVDINEFNELEAAQSGPELYKMYESDAGYEDNDDNDSNDETDDDCGPPSTPSPTFRPAKTTTKKVVAKLVFEKKKVVPKKQAAGKTTTNGSVAKQKPIVIYDSDDNDTIIVEPDDEEPQLPSRRMRAAVQAQNAMENEEETEDEDFQNGDYQSYAAWSNNWRFDCICKTKDQAAIKAADVECTECRAWSHQMCYGYDSQEIDNENFTHLCPTCHLESMTTRKPTTNKKRKFNDEGTTGNKKSKHTAEHTEGGKGKMKWTDHEKKHLCNAMEEHFRRANAGECDRLYDLKLFAILSEMIKESGGVNRNANACKNEWNRSCREISGLDERKVPNYGKLSTSLQ